MNKRYYWIKLKTDFFEQETIDFLMSQKNGCQYIVLYQMLCLKTANTDGELISQVGEMIVPYDINKIVRDTKYFDVDTVTVALELFARLGLIYYGDNKTLKIANYGEMVGSETDSAKRVREFRQRKALQCNTDVTQENRDKSIDNRDIDNKKKENKRFARPSVEEVEAYCKEHSLNVNVQQFVDYYDSNGWKVGKNAMKDWKATCRNWSRRENKDAPKGKMKRKPSFDIDEIAKKAKLNEEYDID